MGGRAGGQRVNFEKYIFFPPLFGNRRRFYKYTFIHQGVEEPTGDGAPLIILYTKSSADTCVCVNGAAPPSGQRTPAVEDRTENTIWTPAIVLPVVTAAAAADQVCVKGNVHCTANRIGCGGGARKCPGGGRSVGHTRARRTRQTCPSVGGL